ncbi:hypothetical protein IEQ34_018823 [Dendrobium chrysotoxum]|uniref:Uncharacterized protein n=1 Tax=Dendrobium chrysotoxum TaxID=161865 RepID=A0AAV7G6C1_DENCH|nr:hypothetical protein IEQ34_018823 [Dendrobium chrysotoxum]
MVLVFFLSDLSKLIIPLLTSSSRSSVARILVELDVTKQFLDKVWIGPENLGYIQSIINHLYVEIEENYFGGDIRNWPMSIATGIPTQINGFDRKMFICKYMEATILSRAVKWEEQLHWQLEMPKYRAEFAYAILCEIIK